MAKRKRSTAPTIQGYWEGDRYYCAPTGAELERAKQERQRERDFQKRMKRFRQEDRAAAAAAVVPIAPIS